MAFGSGTARTLKIKRNRKLPQREIVDADFVVPSSNKTIDDLLLERAPSQHDRSILSELWGGNASNFDRDIMPTVSIGKPKRSLNNDSSTRSRTYKDMLKETHKDDWKLDLSNLTFVPPTAKGKHIRSVYNDSKPLITETSKVAFEIETEDMDSEYVVQVDDKLQDAESDKNCSDEGNQNNLDEVEKLEEGSNTEFESLDKITKTAADYTLPLQHKDFIPKENHCEHSTNQNTTNDHCLEVKQEKINYLTVVDFENDAMQDGNMINNDTDDGLYEYSEEECKTDQGMIKQPVVMYQSIESNYGESNDLKETEILPTIDDKLSSKGEVSQEPQMAETSPSISSGLKVVNDQQLVPETCVAENEQLEQPPTQLIPSTKENIINIPLFGQIAGECDDNNKVDDQENEQLLDIITAPLLRHLLSSETENSRMISKKDVQDEKPLLNLGSSVSDAEEHIKSKSKIIKRWQQNQKRHRILNILKDTTALHWIENGKDISYKKELGFVRKRQLEQKFNKPFVIKKRIKGCWIVEDC